VHLLVKELSSGSSQNFRFESPVPFVPIWDTPTSVDPQNEQQHFITGILKAHLGWAQDDLGKPLQPPLPSG
jgi:hypothetical protein